MDERVIVAGYLSATESIVWDEFEASSSGKRLTGVLRDARANFDFTDDPYNAGGMTRLERGQLQIELKKFASDPAHQSSLKAGIQQMTIIERSLDLVQDHKAYQIIDKAFMLETSRRDGLPDDDARKAIRSHKTRLANINRTRMSKEERKVLKQRQKNMDRIEKIYIDLQKKALGIA